MNDTRLTIEYLEKRLDDPNLDIRYLAKELIATMQREAKLRELLKRVTEDTEYSCMPADLQEAIESELRSE